MLIPLDPRKINVYVWFWCHIKETMVSVPVHVFARSGTGATWHSTALVGFLSWI